MMHQIEPANGLKRSPRPTTKGVNGDAIGLWGVRTNNLKNLDASFPLGQFTVVTGVSGSGKSSLVFDTLYAESYRRYVESLSSFARQYLKALPKPQIDDVRNLPPAIAVKQARAGLNNRSTVGTLTELFDILRILFTHLSEVICHQCHQPVRKENGESLGKRWQERSGQKITILAPLQQWGKMKAADLKVQLQAQGFSRLWSDNGLVAIEDCPAKALNTSSVVIDRLSISEENQSRLVDSLNLGFKVGRGVLQVMDGEGKRHSYANQYRCVDCGIDYREPNSALFNFNHPLGACLGCQGFGQAMALDEDKVLPDKNQTLASHGVAPWNFGQHEAYYKVAFKSASAVKVDINKPFSRYTAAEKRWLFEGEKGSDFEGVNGYFAWLDSKKYKPHYRIHAARFRRYVTCPQCHGDRLNPMGLSCQINGENLAQVANKPVKELNLWLQRLQEAADRWSVGVSDHSAHSYGVREAVDEGASRIGYLMKIGLGYLTLNRSAKTLSGGELQRINMARSLGSALTDTLFCLDEPSSGLHARDSRNLLEVIKELQNQGNTVVVVEHEKTIIEGADRLMEIGPEAGHKGGHIVFEGDPKARLTTIEPDWTSVRHEKVLSEKDFFEIRNAATHNLQNLAVKFPIGRLTAVCGVSGSGKTSLIEYTLFPLLQKALGTTPDRSGVEPNPECSVGPLNIIQKHQQVILVSQEGIGRSSRSNIATYLNILGDIRKVLAAQPLAKSLNLTTSHFSFNRPGGRCETCEGLGTVVEDLSFLGEMAVMCPVCEGRRFSDEVLSVKYKNLNLLDILNLTVEQAREFFFDSAPISRILDHIIELGLGYVTLGQSTSSFSGGEAQRLKLLSLLRENRDDKPAILIFDEPTTGLSDHDVFNLLKQLRSLTTKGHTVIVVEHHLGVLKAADWLVEIGPEAADLGGLLVYEGSPAGIGRANQSLTAPFLNKSYRG